jgi:hypothetical protein
LSALRSASLDVDSDRQCVAEVQAGDLDVEVWFPYESDVSGAPSLEAVGAALAQVTAFDDVVQAELEAEALVSTHAPQNFMFDLAVMTLAAAGDVTLGYWGTEVNSQFDARFVYRDEGWHRA